MGFFLPFLPEVLEAAGVTQSCHPPSPLTVTPELTFCCPTPAADPARNHWGHRKTPLSSQLPTWTGLDSQDKAGVGQGKE